MKKPKSGITKRPRELEKVINDLVDKVNGIDIMLGTVITAKAEAKAKAKAKIEKENTNEKV